MTNRSIAKQAANIASNPRLQETLASSKNKNIASMSLEGPLRVNETIQSQERSKIFADKYNSLRASVQTL